VRLVVATPWTGRSSRGRVAVRVWSQASRYI